MNKEGKSNAGRKWFDGKDENEVVTKLKEAWLNGANDAEAAFNADISKMSLSRYLEAHPVISLQKEQWKNKPNLKSKEVLLKVISGYKFRTKEIIDGKIVEVEKNILPDGNLALKLLERKCKDEYSLRNELTGANGNPIQTNNMNIDIDMNLKDIPTEKLEKFVEEYVNGKRNRQTGGTD